MSLQAMTAVLERSRAELGARLVMIALANYADETLCSCPAVGTIAAHANMSDRAARAALRRLEALGEIEKVGVASEYRTTIYRLNLPLEGGTYLPPPEVHDRNVSSTSPEGVVPLTQQSLGNNNGSGEASFRPRTLAVEFDEFMADYREVTGRAARGSAAARKAFSARRRDDHYSLDELKLATRGAHGDPWIREHGFDVPETILRGSNTYRYVELARGRGETAAAVERRTEQGVRQLSRDGGETWETDWEAVG